jgi:CxC2 like cysteine cluster associated with KDZ transposases
MRRTHKENPLHRIEQWNGGYFRPAELWEVGTYLLVKHHIGDGICNTLKICCDFLESAEETKDSAEQEHIRLAMELPPVPVPVPLPEEIFYDDNTDDAQPEEGNDENDEDDIDELDEEEVSNPYLESNAGAGAGAGARLFGSAMPRSYVRVVHSNGLHHIAMVSCHCQGDDILPLDLIAGQLLPASFKRIRTLFTAQVLDLYRLCNLELKSSAYQFYQLMRRLTLPMAPAEVPNLYREFRRMSRIWRWMKKLKWAGYAGSTKKVEEVGAGDLAIYCPACPQPGVNIPDNWKEDTARQDKPFFNVCIL